VLVAIALCVSAHPLKGFRFPPPARYLRDSIKKDTYTFTPNKPPCSGFQATFTASDGDEAISYVYSSLGNFRKFVVSKDSFSSYEYIRSDINHTEEGVVHATKVSAFFASTECKEESDSLSADLAYYENTSPTSIFYQETVFTSMEEVDFQGVKCKKYCADFDTSLCYYVNSDSRVIAIIISDPEGSSSNITFSYDLNVPLSTFTVPQSQIAGCNEKVYSEPTGYRCDIPSPSPQPQPSEPRNSSSSSMIKAVFAVVIASVSFGILA